MADITIPVCSNFIRHNRSKYIVFYLLTMIKITLFLSIKNITNAKSYHKLAYKVFCFLNIIQSICKLNCLRQHHGVCVSLVEIADYTTYAISPANLRFAGEMEISRVGATFSTKLTHPSGCTPIIPLRERRGGSRARLD